MKRLILFELVRMATRNPHSRRKLKWFGIASIGIAVMVLGFGAWATIATANYVFSNASSWAGSVSSQALLQPGCLDKIRASFDPVVWLEQPVADNIREIKEICIRTTTQPKGGDS